jgi:cellulose synthase/poly-beta-1,6-N-acetylglucosamine synthase-like glycosyltransferase
MIETISQLLFLIFASLISAYLVRHFVFTLAVLKGSSQKRESRKVNINSLPSISIMIPAHNEERVIGRTLRRMAELKYPREKLQIIVIDDASTDDTGRLIEEFAKNNPVVEILRRTQKEGGRGKAAALNAGLQLAHNEIVTCFDADYYPQVDILPKLVSPFEDSRVGLVQGRVTVLNEPHNLVTRLVALERVGGYRVDQQARESLQLIPQFGGTVGGIRRSLLLSLGGWNESILAEDTDLTFRVVLAGFKICYVNSAECYEEAVENLRAYWRQRYRWARGHMQCAFRHSHSVLTSRRLTLREKVDGVLLLNLYFMPVVALLLWITFIPLFLLGSSQSSAIASVIVPIPLYSFVGNFAPFFEVGVGSYLDGRSRAHWLMSLLAFLFLYNIPICTKALVDLLVSKIMRRESSRWDKTEHSGYGNSYIVN